MQSPNMVKWAKMGPKIKFFCHFFKFGSFIFQEIKYDNSLKHCPTTSGGKTYEKNFWGYQIGSKIRVFAIFSRLHHYISLILHKIAVWDDV